MRTIEQIKLLRAQGHRKWGMDLYRHITPWVEQFLSMDEISQRLSDEHGLQITGKRLRYILHYYRRKLEKPASAAASFPPASFSSTKSIAQNQESKNIHPSSPSHFQPNKKLIIDEDFRTPIPKPRPVFRTNEASDS